MKITHAVTAFVVALFTPLAHSYDLKPPQILEYGNKSYQLSSAAKIPEQTGDRMFYRYTTGDETKDQWTSMIIVQFSPNFHLKNEAWAKDLKSYFDASKPRPYYGIEFFGGKPFARYMNPPINGQLSESSIMRFYPDSCGGQAVFQYIEKVDVTDVRKTWSKNQAAMFELSKLSWEPECVIEQK